MHRPLPPLNALRAFEAAARHLSLTKAAGELHVTAGALSHQIRGLEDMLGVKLFERRVRSIALTPEGQALYPGLQTGFVHIQNAVATLSARDTERVLTISTSPGFTSKWLAPRLYRFAAAHPEIDARISSSYSNSNFVTDGVDVAVRNMPTESEGDPALLIETLIEMVFVPVCSPRLVEQHGPLDTAEALARAPLIHDDSLANRRHVPHWGDWFEAAGVANAELARGLRFSGADHAIEAAGEGAGVLLSHNLMAYDDVRTGRLVVPVPLTLRSRRAYHVVCLKGRSEHAHVRAFRDWIRQEIVALDWRHVYGDAARLPACGKPRGKRREKAR